MVPVFSIEPEMLNPSTPVFSITNWFWLTILPLILIPVASSLLTIESPVPLLVIVPFVSTRNSPLVFLIAATPLVLVTLPFTMKPAPSFVIFNAVPFEVTVPLILKLPAVDLL